MKRPGDELAGNIAALRIERVAQALTGYPAGSDAGPEKAGTGIGDLAGDCQRAAHMVRGDNIDFDVADDIVPAAVADDCAVGGVERPDEEGGVIDVAEAGGIDGNHEIAIAIHQAMELPPEHFTFCDADAG